VSVVPSVMWGLRKKIKGGEVDRTYVAGLAGYSGSAFWRPVKETQRPSLRDYRVVDGRICR
jgi:hypothetical protein